jgi:hypothetical protein
MKKTSALTTLHGNFGISRTIHNANSVPIGLGTVGHEAYKVWMWDTVAGHDVVEVLPKKNLGILILRLEITACNGHDPLISSIVHMSGHGGPPFDPLDVVGHHPRILEVPTRLHPTNQIHTTSRTNLGHLEDEHLVCIVPLTWKLVPLDVSPIANAPELCDAIHNTEPPQKFERGNLRTKVRGIQLSTTLKDRFELFQGEETLCVIITRKEEITYNVLAGFEDDLAVRGLRRTVNVLLEKSIDALSAVSADSNLDWMLMSTDMNAGSLGGLLPMDVEDFGIAKCNTFGRLFADPADKSRSGWHNARERERIFSETFKFRVVDLRCTMGTLKVITTRVLALEMANTGRGTKSKANVVCNVGGLSLRPNMAIILLVHTVQGLGPGLRGRGFCCREDK